MRLRAAIRNEAKLSHPLSSKDFDKEVFISYSRIDADRILDFISSLQDSGIDYWLDEIEIGWGESIVEKVFSGIESSRYVIVFVTENSLKSPWVKKEIHTAFHKEIESDLVILLPVLSCSAELFFEQFPFLRSKKFINFDSRDYVVANLLKLLRGDPNTNFTFNHPREHHGPVWLRLMAKGENGGTEHRVRIRWGVWYREITLMLTKGEPIFLTHSKGNDGQSTPIVVEVDKPAYVSAGQGRPNSRRQVDINPFWVDARSRLKMFIARTFLWPRSSN